MSPRDVLFVHNNFPGQFGFLAEALGASGWRCAVLAGPQAPATDLPTARWRLQRGTTNGIYHSAVRAEADMLRGRAALDAARALKDRGFDPSLVIGHPGWGETLFLKEVFPQARTILYGEYFYNASGFDVGFDPEFPTPDLNERVRVTAKNATLGMAYLQADAIVSPTRFQASTLPPALSDRVHVIHEGVDLDRFRRRRAPGVRLPSGAELPVGAPFVTYVSRHLEPLRGFHVFMRALPDVLKARPDAHAILIGECGRGYGAEAGETSWRDRLLLELGDRLDLTRVHFVGRLPHHQMLDILSHGAAHVYYTYPFVLSWSLLEAMALGCLVLGSDTEPVREAVTDGVSGRLAPFFDTERLAASMISACADPSSYADLRQGAREAIQARFDRHAHCLPEWLSLVARVVDG